MTHDGSSFFKDGARSASGRGPGGPSQQDLQETLAWMAQMGQRLGEAQGLVAQVSKALAEGDEEEAQTRTQTAARLPYDEDEGHWTGTLAAHQHLYDTVTDFLESWPSDDPSAWVDTVVEHVHAATGHAEQELRGVVGEVANDYPLPPAHAKRLEQLGIGSEQGYTPQELPELADRAEHIRQVAALAADLTRALGERATTLTVDT